MAGSSRGEPREALVSPQHSGASAATNGKRESHMVSPMSLDHQVHREIHLSYPEVYLAPPEERSPEIVFNRDGSDAPEVVPSNDPGYHVDEKYAPPQWYRDEVNTPIKQESVWEHVGRTRHAAVLGAAEESNQSGLYGGTTHQVAEPDTGKDDSTKTKRRVWTWLGIAAAILLIVALAFGLGVGLGLRKTNGSAASSEPPTSTIRSSTWATVTTSSSALPSSTVRCPSSNDTTYVSNSKSFVVECGIDHSGGNLDTVDAVDLVDCIDSCAESNQCVGATFLGAACYLKSIWSDPIFSNGEVAGGRLVS
ncbi:hypothetical protein CERZMDRAFT_88216 [Cercospora zeae-maydis SCOH1-5]|uniref:Apple domain-containing protein n=1 Tax=Cercospora zeae-maydis SCOH1-5 TaxID=717836 RepID=A0A6A6F3E3_9PEZI|nr:hypothetical protein CERZMDRAFT_88216 [Cercospora zeae-maydis SCOH1-5]